MSTTTTTNTTSSKAKLWWTIAIVFVVFGGVFLIQHNWSKHPPITAEKYMMIQPGQTKADVQMILGDPDDFGGAIHRLDKLKNGDFENYLSYESGMFKKRSIHVYFKNKLVVHKEQTGLVLE